MKTSDRVEKLTKEKNNNNQQKIDKTQEQFIKELSQIDHLNKSFYWNILRTNHYAQELIFNAASEVFKQILYYNERGTNKDKLLKELKTLASYCMRIYCELKENRIP